MLAIEPSEEKKPTLARKKNIHSKNRKKRNRKKV